MPILQVARFHPVKDHATAVRALAEVIEEVHRHGAGADRVTAKSVPDIESLVNQLEISPPACSFLGVRNDVPRLMSAADVFLLSSLSEGISVTTRWKLM